MPTNLSTDVSPLAQRLADAYDVDLAILREKYIDDKITARNVLEHLDTSGERASLKRKRLKPTAQKSGSDELKPTFNLVATPKQGDPAMSEIREVKPGKPNPESVPEPTLKQPAEADNPALAQTRAQLQATARVHQQALLEVGSLRQQNSALDTEVERLRVLEAQARADLERLAQGKRQLELELERSKGAVKPFSWLRKLVS